MRSVPCRRRTRLRRGPRYWRWKRPRACPGEMTRFMASPRMTRSENVSVPSTFFLMRLISPASASSLSALLIDTSRRSGLAGLTTKSTAPARMAEIAVSIDPCAVCTMMGHPGLGGDALHDAHAVDTGHDEVEEHEGDAAVVFALEDLEGMIAGPAGLGLEAETFDRLFENTALAGSSSTIRTRLDMRRDLTRLLHGRLEHPLMLQDWTQGHRQLTQRGQDCPTRVNGWLRRGAFFAQDETNACLRLAGPLACERQSVRPGCLHERPSSVSALPARLSARARRRTDRVSRTRAVGARCDRSWHLRWVSLSISIFRQRSIGSADDQFHAQRTAGVG